MVVQPASCQQLVGNRAQGPSESASGRRAASALRQGWSTRRVTFDPGPKVAWAAR